MSPDTIDDDIGARRLAVTRTCATCRFFGAPGGVRAWDDAAPCPYGGSEPGDTRETPHHACARIIHGNGDDLPFAIVAAEPAIVTDGSGYAARLRVLPTFGCALHEAKEGSEGR